MPQPRYFSCIVDGCRVKEEQYKFSIPRNNKKREKWLININRADMLSMPYSKLKQFIICRRHFADNLFHNHEELKFDAVPTLNIRFPNIESVSVSSPLSQQPSTSQMSDCPMEVENSNNSILNTSSPGLSMRNSDSDNSLEETGVTKTKSATPRERKMRSLQRKPKKVINALKFQNSDLIVGNSRDKRKKQKLSSILNFDLLPSALTRFLYRQLSCTKSKSRAFTQSQKSMFLSVYLHVGFYSYHLLKQLFSFLPSIRTLQRIQCQLKLEPGINLQLFNYLNVISEQLQHDKMASYCVLIWDKMAISAGLQFHGYNRSVNGFQHLSDGKSSFIADQALVFMIRSINREFKQPVAFYFFYGIMNPSDLAACIKQIVQAIHECTKFKIVASVSRMESLNVSAIKHLVGETNIHLPNEERFQIDAFHYVINSKTIIHLFDPPHLVKCMRDLFHQHDVLFKGSIAKWEHLELVHKYTASLSTYARLSEHHLNPTGKQKMKVKLALQVFSATVAAILSLMQNLNRDLGKNDLLATGTINFLRLVDSLFDSLNSQGTTGKLLRRRLTATSAHWKFWKTAVVDLRKLQFLKDGQPIREPPCILGFLVTLQNVKCLWQILKSLGFRSLKTRSLNLDPFENFFNIIRCSCGPNRNPNSSQFVAAFSKALINNVFKFGPAANCEDNSQILLNLNALLSSNNVSKNPSQLPEMLSSIPVVPARITNEALYNRLRLLNIVNIAGYILWKCLNRKCQTCVDSLLFTSCADVHDLTSLRDVGTESGSYLTYPAELYIDFLIHLQSEFDILIPQVILSKNVINDMIQKVSNISLNLPCKIHCTQLTLKSKLIFIRFLIFRFTKIINPKLTLKCTYPSSYDDFLLNAYPKLEIKLKKFN